MNAITFSDIKKIYGSQIVLNAVSSNIAPGQVVGLLGRNGAGKTTLLQILYGLISPDSGSRQILGLDPKKDLVEMRRKVGFVSEECHYYKWMTAMMLEKFLAPLYPSWTRDTYKTLMTNLEIPVDKKIGELSKGTRRKLMLAAAVAMKPELLLLDEPLGGMDLVVRGQVLTTIIDTLTERGVTILISSHEIDEISGVCDKVIILSQGNFIIDEEVSPLTQSVRKIVAILESPVESFPTHQQIISAKSQGTQLELVVKNFTDDLPRTLLSNYKTKDIKVEGLSLEQIFIALAAKKEELL